jgi:hypothetical protein
MRNIRPIWIFKKYNFTPTQTQFSAMRAVRTKDRKASSLGNKRAAVEPRKAKFSPRPTGTSPGCLKTTIRKVLTRGLQYWKIHPPPLLLKEKILANVIWGKNYEKAKRKRGKM